MKIGTVFPQNEFPADLSAVRDYTQAVDDMNYAHILAYDHVLGANPDRPEGWRGPYTYEHPFLSPFLLFSYMAAMTTQLEFASGIIILPQRQTALAAKQAATLDLLSGGRFRFGVGIGWNHVEYIALNEDFSNRGKRVEEQVMLMKKLWAEPLITYEGQWHTIPDAGLAPPLPASGSIPVWFGGHHENTVKRVAQMADGWMPSYRTPDDERLAAHMDLLNAELEKAGRTRDEIGFEARISYQGDPDAAVELIEGWRAFGATHVSINTMYQEHTSIDQHLADLRQVAKRVL